MNKHVLQVGHSFYRIIDCEFYYYSDSHRDLYTHGHEQQMNSFGEWYFHGSGLDITLGNSSCYGGILLTAIAQINARLDSPFLAPPVVGSLNICTEIFKGFGSTAVDHPVPFGLLDISRDPMSASMPEARIFAVPRVGLERKKDIDGFHDAPYRFLSFLHLRHKKNDFIKDYLVKESKVLSSDEFKMYKSGTKWQQLWRRSACQLKIESADCLQNQQGTISYYIKIN